MKTKAFSKEGLGQAAKLDPREKARNEMRDWINETVDKLTAEVRYSWMVLSSQPRSILHLWNSDCAGIKTASISFPYFPSQLSYHVRGRSAACWPVSMAAWDLCFWTLLHASGTLSCCKLTCSINSHAWASALRILRYVPIMGSPAQSLGH